MSLEKFSYIIAIILLLSSIISPIVVAIINNMHQTKMKRIEIFENNKTQALANFIENAQQVAYNPTDSETVLNYANSFNVLFLYFSNISLDTVSKFDQCRTEIVKNDTPENFQKANRELTNIVQELSKQIVKM